MEDTSQEKQPSRLIALVFDDMYAADEARAALRRMAGDYRWLDLDETAMVIKAYDGKIRISQDKDIVSRDQQAGHIAGLVCAAATGTVPFILAGTVGGKLIGRLTDIGITNKFIQQVTDKLQPGRSALIVLGRAASPESRQQVVDGLQKFRPQVVESDLPPDLEKELTAGVTPETSA
jgi:uncharacterized membrane protein